MSIRINSDQLEYRGVLDQLTTQAATETGMESILPSINKAVTVPLRLREANPVSRTIAVDSNVVTNPVHGRKQTSSPIGSIIPAFAGGTLTLPASSGGTITSSGMTISGTTTLTVSSDNFIKMLMALNSAGEIQLSFGTQGASEAAATLPVISTLTIPVGYAVIQNLAGVIQNVAATNLYQIGGAGVISGDIANNGNAFGSAITIGTNDAFALRFETTATVRGSISAAGAFTLGNVSQNNIHQVFSGTTGTEGVLKIVGNGTGGTFLGLNENNSGQFFGVGMDTSSTTLSIKIGSTASTAYWSMTNGGVVTTGPSSGLTAAHVIQNQNTGAYVLTINGTNVTSGVSGLKIRAGLAAGAGTATEVPLAVSNSANTANYLIVRGDGSLTSYNNNNTIQFAKSALGNLTIGASGGLGTSGNAYHQVYGSVVGGANSAAAMAYASQDRINLNANLYRDGASTVKAVSTAVGYTSFEIARTASSTGIVLAMSANYQDAQTANSAAVVTNDRTIVTANASGAWTFGTASSTNTNLTVNGSAQILANDSTLRIANGANDSGAFFGHRQSDNAALWGTLGTSNVVFRINSADRGGIDNNGSATFGATSGSGVSHNINGGANAAAVQGDYVLVATNRNATGTSAGMFLFRDAATDITGSISINASANTTAFNTSSDARLKHLPEDFDGTGLVKLISAKRYERLSDPGVKEIGFYAQELYEVFPQAVNVGSDAAVAVDSEDFMPWSIDYSKLTPVLVKAIQELTARIEALEGA